MPRPDAAHRAVDHHALPLAAGAGGERALVAAVQGGDLQAFRTLHAHFVTELLDFAFSYLRSREDAEEVVQDLFLWIWEHRHEWDAPRELRAYLFKSIRNRAINRLRQAKLQARFVERVGQGAVRSASEAAASPDALAAVTAGELDAILAETIATLPPRCHEVYLLVRERGLAYAEVAALLGIAPKTVEVHINHALGILRRRVAEWRGR
jgi:RNA polymerase sigma-70 factor (family 1)